MKPVVKRRIRGINMVREGRGYSLAELREVGLDYFKAMQQQKTKKIPIDRFRNSKHTENVERLKRLLGGKA